MDGFNIIDEQYFAADLENEAVQRRLAEALADQITHPARRSISASERPRAADARREARCRSACRRFCAILAPAGSYCCMARMHGMIRDRAAALVRAVAGSLDDPFLVAELARDEVGRSWRMRRRRCR